MAGHTLIDAYVRELARHLPAAAVAELADGLIETYDHHVHEGLGRADAVRVAIAEFGTPDEVVVAFTRNAPGRRAARVLLVTGPVVGAAWGASLGRLHFWTWPVPVWAQAAGAATLVAAVVLLVIAATSRRNYRRTKLAAVAAAAMMVLDLTMLTVICLLTPAWVWPLAIAMPASLARIGLAGWQFCRVLAI